MLASPVIRVVDGASDIDRQLTVLASIRWVAAGGNAASFAGLALGLYLGLLFVLAVPVLAVIIVVQQAGKARVAGLLQSSG